MQPLSHDDAEQVAALRRDLLRLENELDARREVEERLRQSEARYRQLVESASELIYRTDAAGRFTFVNDAFRRLLHPRGSGELRDVYLDYIVPEKRAEVERFYSRQFLKRLPNTYFEVAVTTDDGAPVWLGQNAQTIIEEGEIVGFQVVARDITERKRAEEAERRSREYRDLFRLANDAILILEPETERVLDVNYKACEIYGVPREQFLGRSMKEFSADPAAGEPRTSEMLASGSHLQFETTHRARDGSTIRFLINCSLIEHDGQRAVLSINRDITERERLEAQLSQSQKMEAVGQLAGGIAHDFNNLLSVITGYCNLGLRRLGEDDPVRRHVSEIRSAAERAAALTGQLLAFSRRQVLQPLTLDLNDTVAGVVRMLERIIGVDVEMNLELDSTIGSVRADPHQIEQVLMNLAVNARDAMPDGGKLLFHTANVELDEEYAARHVAVAPGAYVMLAVSDTGGGMDDSTRARIFEPFFTTKERGKGTGLGLATVYGIIKQSGGNIWVYSEPGHGTTFKIYLPRVAGSRAETSAEACRAEADVAGGSEVVLLADDDAAVRRMAGEILESYGYTVIAAADGDEALRLYAERGDAIDLLLTDVLMPRTTGIELTERLRAEREELPVIFMSGYPGMRLAEHNLHIARHNLDLDAAIFIQKPFTPETLGRAVREALGAADR